MKYWREYAIAVLIVLLAIGFKMWLEGHDQVIKAEAEIAGQNLLIEEKQRALVQAEEDRGKIQAEAQLKQDELENLRKSIPSKTPAQIVKELPQVIPVAFDLKPSGEVLLPDAPSQLAKLYDFGVQCKECSFALSARIAEVENLDSQLKILGEEKKAVETQRDIAVKMHKTGFWNRTKWFVAGGVLGAGAYAAVRH